MPNSWKFLDGDQNAKYLLAAGSGLSTDPFISLPRIEGRGPNASPPSGFPLDIAWDGTNVLRLKTDAAGNLLIGGQVAISGYVTTGGGVSSSVVVTSGLSFKGGFWSLDGITPITGSVTIANSPAVTLASGNVAVLGAVTINGTVPISVASPLLVSGYVNQGGTWSVAVNNTPAVTLASTVVSSITNIAAISGFVDVKSLPNVTIAGTVPVSIAGTVTTSLASTTITGTVATTSVSGLMYEGGVWSVRNQDGAGNALISATSDISQGTLGLVTRVVGTAPVSGISTFRVDPVGTTAQPVSQNGTWSNVGVTGYINIVGNQTATVSSGYCVQGGQWNINSITNPVYTTGYLIVASWPAMILSSGAISLNPAISGGMNSFSVVHPANTQSHVVKNANGHVYGFHCGNISPYPIWLKIYDSTSGVVGTSTPKLRLCVPGNTAGAGFAVDYNNGIAFSAGISIGAVSGILDSDTTNVQSNSLTINALYK